MRCRCRKWCWNCVVGVGTGDDIYDIGVGSVGGFICW